MDDDDKFTIEIERDGLPPIVVTADTAEECSRLALAEFSRLINQMREEGDA